MSREGNSQKWRMKDNFWLGLTLTTIEWLWVKVQKDDGRVGLSILDEPTWRCHQNPFVGALGIQEPVILGEPQILTVNR